MTSGQLLQSCSDSEEPEQDWSDGKDEHSTSPIPQPYGKKRSESPDSGNVSGDDVESKPTSPLHSEQKAKKPPVPPKSADLQMRPKTPFIKKESDADPVNSKIQDPSTLSVKERARMFGNLSSKRKVL